MAHYLQWFRELLRNNAIWFKREANQAHQMIVRTKGKCAFRFHKEESYEAETEYRSTIHRLERDGGWL
jgi:hypothetical protein